MIRNLAMLGIVAALATLARGQVAPAVQPPPPTGWEADVLAGIGNAEPTQDTILFLAAWHRAEGGNAAFNWLNTTQDAPGATCYNSDPCVKNYPDYQTGIQATVSTLMNGQYAEIVAGLRTDDAARALAGLHASPWGSSAALVQEVQEERAPPSVGSYASNPISLAGDCGWNVKVALEGNGGALRHIKLAPGETFSFNATMGAPDDDPALRQRRYCAGVDGGNWCNLAARYAQAARTLGLTPQFQDHGLGDLGGGAENSIMIWNVDGRAGGQDLLIQNTTDRPVVFRAVIAGDQLIIEGGFVQ